MELGLTSFAETHTDPSTGEAISHGERLRNVVAEIVKAEQTVYHGGAKVSHVVLPVIEK